MSLRLVYNNSMLIDTHAHIHFADSFDDLPVVLQNARDNGVTKIITVGTDMQSSQAALALASSSALAAAKTGVQIFASIGLHPNCASSGELDEVTTLARQEKTSIIAIGECGLDYYRDNAPRDEQIKALEAQIELALELDLPLIFHVREAWDDFTEVLVNYENIRGVVHSFTGGPEEVEKLNALGLYFGLNGIMTFTKNAKQLEAAKLIPADKLLLETDCPYLAPAPLRGKRNEPANVAIIAKFLAELRGEVLPDFISHSVSNSSKLFQL